MVEIFSSLASSARSVAAWFSSTRNSLLANMSRAGSGGSLNMFAHETNVDIANRIISFDLYEMGEQLKPSR